MLLTRASQATRSELFGVEDLYRASLFVPVGVSGLTRLQRADTPKTLQVDVLYDGSLPDEITADGTEELEPALRLKQQERFDRGTHSLRRTTRSITYAPGAGTAVIISGRTVITDRSSRTDGAFLDIWLGQTPTSEKLRQLC